MLNNQKVGLVVWLAILEGRFAGHRQAVVEDMLLAAKGR
jgi:hypothetical protein